MILNSTFSRIFLISRLCSADTLDTPLLKWNRAALISDLLYEDCVSSHRPPLTPSLNLLQISWDCPTFCLDCSLPKRESCPLESISGDKLLYDKAEDEGESFIVKVVNHLKIYKYLGPKINHFWNKLFRVRSKEKIELISSWRFCAGEESLYWFVSMTDLGKSDFQVERRPSVGSGG